MIYLHCDPERCPTIVVRDVGPMAGVQSQGDEVTLP